MFLIVIIFILKATFVGHNHGNDFCGSYEGNILLCFGRHTGYGGYGRWERGSRIIQLRLSSSDSLILPGDKSTPFIWKRHVRKTNQTQWTMKTWIRYEDGRKEVRY